MKILINIIFSIIIWGSVGYTAYKVITKAPSDFIGKSDRRFTAVQITFFALLFRLAVYAISVLLVYKIDGSLSGNIFLDRWTRWDANNYIRITDGWYTGYTENGDYLTLVFFPLYSIIAKLFTFIIPNVQMSLMTTSSIAFAVGCGYLYELVCLDYEESIAVSSVIGISVFPFAFFFGAIMTESVFFMTTVMTFYYIRKHNWFLAGLCGAFSALSRMIGVFIIVPAFVEWFDYCKPFSVGRYKLKKIIIDVLPVFSVLLGIGVYLLINYCITGNPFMFMEYQDKYWNHTNCYFGKTVADIFQYALNPKTDNALRISIWLPEMLIFTITAIALIYGAYSLRGMYTVYLAGYMVINCSVTWLISGARYMSAAIPLFIIIANKMNKKILPIVYILSFGLMIFYMYRYLANMQVM